MSKICNKIEIESSYGWGSEPQLSDKIVIYPNQITYDYTIHKMGKLIEVGSSKITPEAFEDLEYEHEFSKLFEYVGKTEFKVRDDVFVLDGGTLLMTLFYDDDSKEEVRAPAEDIEEASCELFSFLGMLSYLLRNSSIRPTYLNVNRVVYEDECDDDFQENRF